MKIEDLDSRINALEALKEAPGYQLFQQVINASVQAAEAALLIGKPVEDSFLAAQLIGGWRTSKQLSTWVDREIEACREQLKLIQRGR